MVLDLITLSKVFDIEEMKSFNSVGYKMVSFTLRVVKVCSCFLGSRYSLIDYVFRCSF